VNCTVHAHKADGRVGGGIHVFCVFLRFILLVSYVFFLFLWPILSASLSPPLTSIQRELIPTLRQGKDTHRSRGRDKTEEISLNSVGGKEGIGGLIRDMG